MYDGLYNKYHKTHTRLFIMIERHTYNYNVSIKHFTHKEIYQGMQIGYVTKK